MTGQRDEFEMYCYNGQLHELIHNYRFMLKQLEKQQIQFTQDSFDRVHLRGYVVRYSPTDLYTMDTLSLYGVSPKQYTTTIVLLHGSILIY